MAGPRRMRSGRARGTWGSWHGRVVVACFLVVPAFACGGPARPTSSATTAPDEGASTGVERGASPGEASDDEAFTPVVAPAEAGPSYCAAQHTANPSEAVRRARARFDEALEVAERGEASDAAAAFMEAAHGFLVPMRQRPFCRRAGRRMRTRRSRGAARGRSSARGARFERRRQRTRRSPRRSCTRPTRCPTRLVVRADRVSSAAGRAR